MLSAEMSKCRIQLYDTNGHFKKPEFTSGIIDRDVPLTSNRKQNRKTRYLLKIARGIQSGLNHYANDTPKEVEKISEYVSEPGTLSTVDIVQSKPLMIKRRRTVHGITPLEDKTVIEVDIPSQGMASSSQDTQTSSSINKYRTKGYFHRSQVSFTASQPIKLKERGIESLSRISKSDVGGSFETLDKSKMAASDLCATTEEDVEEEDIKSTSLVDVRSDRPPRKTWRRLATRIQYQRQLKYGKSFQNLLQQNVRKTSLDKAETGMIKRQRTLRKIRSFGDLTDKYEFRTFRPLYKFRRAVRTVIVMMKAASNNSQTSTRTDKDMSWTQVHDEAGTSRRAYERFGLTFDPSVFRANREAQLSTEAKAILSIEPSERTEEQLHLTLINLKTAVDAFGEFPVKMQMSLVRVGWYEHFERRRVIIRQGHVAENFYFILSGTAVVTVLETNKETGEQYGITVAMLKKGNSFGELALMHGARRSATVTCKHDVELLAVGRQDFIDIFMTVETNREADHIHFLRSIDMLHGWPVEVIPPNDPKKCIYTYFRRGVLLCKDSNNTDWIYVVVTGSCRVLKALYATQAKFEKSNSAEKSRLNNDFNKFSSISLPVSARESPEECVPRCLLKSRTVSRQSKMAANRRQTSLPVIRNRTQEELQHSAEEHIRQLDEMLGERENTIDLFNEIPRRHKQHSNGDKEKVFVQIQKLGPKEIYGMEQAVFSMMGNTTNTSLVSDGAECVLINRKFFLQHLTENTAKRIRKIIRPIPSDESLQQKLQNKANWEAYKSLTIAEHLVYRRYLQDFLNL